MGLYGCASRSQREKEGSTCKQHEPLQTLLNPWYLLSYVTMSQWKAVEVTGEELGTCPVDTTRLRGLPVDWRRYSTACPVLFQTDPPELRHIWHRYRSSQAQR